MARFLLYLLTLSGCAVALSFTRASTVPFLLISGVIVGLAGPFLDSLVSNWRYLRPAWYSLRYFKLRIRISASYLFRIKLDGGYLLVRGHRWPQYQPVGGVYKVSAGAKEKLDEMGALDDDLVPVDTISRNDRRIRIPGRNLVSFLRWFESGHSRETSPWREFYEELVEPGHVPLSDFPYIFADFIRRDIRPIRFSAYAQSMELLIADIYELRPTQEQIDALQRLRGQGNPDVVWATENQIRRLGTI